MTGLIVIRCAISSKAAPSMNSFQRPFWSAFLSAFLHICFGAVFLLLSLCIGEEDG